MTINDTKSNNRPGWYCPKCGYMNPGTNEVCMGAEMGDGRCGAKRPPPFKNPILSLRSMPLACINESRKCNACGLEEFERIDRGCY